MENNLNRLEKDIEISFKDKNLLKTTFIHRSYLNEHPSMNTGTGNLPATNGLNFWATLSLV